MQHKAGYWPRNCIPSEVEAFAEAVDATVLAAIERVLGVSFDPSTYSTDTNPVVTDFLAELLHDPDPMAAEVATLSEDAVARARSRLHLPTRLKGAGIRRMATVRDAAFIGCRNAILPSYAAEMREAWGRLQAATAGHLGDADAHQMEREVEAASGSQKELTAFLDQANNSRLRNEVCALPATCRERILFNQLDSASSMWTVAIATARTAMTPHELREVAAGYFFLPSPCLAPVVGSQIILPSTEHNPVTLDLYGDALMNLPAPGDAHWRVQHDAIAYAFRDHCVHDLGIALRREVDNLFQQAVPLGNTVPRDELKDLVPDAELSLPAFNVVTGSYDPRSLKSTLLEFKTMRYGVKYIAVPRATAVDRFERSLLGDIQRGLAARDAAWHNTEPGQKGPLRGILDMSENTGMVFGTMGERSSSPTGAPVGKAPSRGTLVAATIAAAEAAAEAETAANAAAAAAQNAASKARMAAAVAAAAQGGLPAIDISAKSSNRIPVTDASESAAPLTASTTPAPMQLPAISPSPKSRPSSPPGALLSAAPATPAGKAFTGSLAGHTGVVLAVAYSPDGASIASAADDGTLRVWDAATGKQRARLTGHTATVTGVAFAADGATLASASWDGTARVWDAASGRCLRVLPAPSLGRLTSVCFSPDGTMLATGSWNDTAVIYSLRSGEAIKVLKGHTDTVSGVAFSPDGASLVSSSWDGSLRVWSVASGATSATLAGHTDWVTSVAVAADGTVLSGARDGTVRLWALGSGKQVGQASSGGSWVAGVALSRDGKTLAAACEDGAARLWARGDLGAEKMAVPAGAAALRGIALSPDGASVTAGGWDYSVRMA
eukprot:jgi/Tetstr1/455786/TSEL_042583.t2